MKDIEYMRKILAESEWELLGFTVDSITGDQEIRRGVPFDKVPRAKWNDAKQFIATFASALNLKPSSTVTEPSVDRESYDGLWRHVSESFDVASNKRQYLSQVLRKGWITSIPADPTKWTEARLVESPTLQPLGAPTYKFLTVRWLNCSRDAIDTMAVALAAIPSFVGPVINGELYAGTWYNSGVTPSTAQDGSGVITLQLSQQYRTLSYNESTTGDIQTDVQEQLGLTTETPASNPVTSATNHVVTQQQKTPNADNSLNVRTTKKTPLPVHVPEFIAAIGEREIILRSEEKHDPSVPNIMTFKASDGSIKTVTLDSNGQPTFPATPVSAAGLGTIAILSHDLDEFLTNNYKKSRTLRKFPYQGMVTYLIYGDLVTVSIQGIQANSTPSNQPYLKWNYVYQIIKAHSRQCFTTPTAAASFASRTNSSVLYDDPNADSQSYGPKVVFDKNDGATVDHTGEDEWEGHSVITTQNFVYAFHYPDPSTGS